MPKTYVVSDTHFDRRMCPLNNGDIDFKFSFHYRNPDYVEDVIADWKSRVNPEDTVIHVGDVMGGRFTKEWAQKIKALPGYKILVRGNHDQAKREKWLEAFDEVHDKYYIHGEVFYCHYPTDPIPYGCKYNIHGHLHEHPRDLNHSILRSYKHFYSFERNYGFVLSEWNWGLVEDAELLQKAFANI